MKTFPKFIKTDENKVDWFRVFVMIAILAFSYQSWKTWDRVGAIMTSSFRSELYAEKSYDKGWDINEKLFELERGINEAGNYAAGAKEAAEAAKRSAAFCEG
mgnify:CR=1 FL=1